MKLKPGKAENYWVVRGLYDVEVNGLSVQSAGGEDDLICCMLNLTGT